LFRRRNEERHELGELPPNQRWIPSILKWGTEHPGIVADLPEVTREEWRLKVDGLVENPTEYNWSSFMELPQTVSVSDFHCVETWSVKDQRWEGVLFSDLMEAVKPAKKAKYVFFESYDSYTSNLPLKDLLRDDVILAHSLNDEPLPQPLGGPMRLIVPHKYAYKSPMWVEMISFMERNRMGFWENRNYSDKADVWKDDRYRLT